MMRRYDMNDSQFDINVNDSQSDINDMNDFICGIQFDLRFCGFNQICGCSA